MQPIIEVNHLFKKYQIGEKQRYYSFRDTLVNLAKLPFRKKTNEGKFWALKDISFKVMPGEVVGIIGRNGAGKSTLLKILSRITPPTKGEVTLRGRVASLLEVGTGFHPELTGRENIYLNGAILGMKRAEIKNKFDEIVNFAEISKFLDTPVKFYSSGMYMRLAFAVAAHLEPEILLVDEVLAVGDAEFQKKCLGKMGEVAKQGRTVLFVSHNMGTVRSLCEQAILLSRGKIAEIGETHKVVQSYLSSWQTKKSNRGEISWNSQKQKPHCDEVELHSIRLLTPSEETENVFKVDKPIKIEVQYKIFCILRGMRIELHLITEEGAIAFASTDQHQRQNKLFPGEYKSTLLIPGNLLNRIKYTVRLQFSIPNVRVLIPGQDYISFICIMGEVRSGYISSIWPGVVAPQLTWLYSKIS